MIKGIGEILFKKNPQARYLNIRVKPFHDVRVTVPRGMSFSAAESFVKSKATWIKKQLAKVKEVEQRAALVYDGKKPVFTRSHRLEVRPCRIETFSVSLLRNIVSVRYPEKLELENPAVQKAIREGLIVAYRQEAKDYLPHRLRELAHKHGLCFNKVFIKNHKSRWGSCSIKNNINLNLHLMRLPDELIDYVLLHELVHTQEKNHGPQFWRLLETKCQGARQLDRSLRKYSLLW